MPLKFKNTPATDLADPSQRLLKDIFSPSKVEIEHAEKIAFSDRIVELFYIIDDEVLSKRDKRLIKDVHEEKKRLKLNLIKLFNCNEELIDTTIKEIKKVETESGLNKEEINQPSSSLEVNAEQNFQPPMNSKEASTGSFNDYLQAIKVSIQFFKGKNIDLSFLAFEINMILAYLLKNSLTFAEKVQLNELILSNRIPGRGLDLENIPDYIYFYEQDPIKTCIALLKDYSKGEGCLGIICRFFSGAWKRNYKEPVNKFLSIYKKNELSDNITICGIYVILKDQGLIFNFDAENKSSLRKILLFCAKLNNEEESLLHLIVNCSYTSFSPLDQERKFGCCFGA
jgi:hypothetical protein